MRTTALVSLVLAAVLATVTVTAHGDRATLVPLAAAWGPVPYAAVTAAAPQDMARAVAAVLAETLGIPPPPYVVLRTYATRAALRHGLVRDAGVPFGVAGDLSATAVGLALPRTVVLLTGSGDPDRVRLVAHEVMHVMQFELAGPTARPAQWLMEGTAEWGAFTVLERLGGVGLAARRDVARIAARAYLARDPAFTPAGVRSAADFLRWQTRVGDLLAYQVAYALAQELVDRRGVRGVVDYFRALGEGTDDAASFERAFATSTAAFIAGVRARPPAPAPDPALPRDA